MENSHFEIEVRELERKYRGDDIKLTDFIKFAESLSPVKQLEVASWDIYYAGNKFKLPFEFLRYRKGEPAQLTIKIKSDEKNNADRFELDLDLFKAKDFIINTFAKLIGFEENFRIYKDCTIYWYDKVDIVYYIVYDKNKKERGRYVEIEARKDAQFSGPEEAWNCVNEMEQKMSALGIIPANRLKKSMWEIFKKD